MGSPSPLACLVERSQTEAASPGMSVRTWLASKSAWMGTWAWPGAAASRARVPLISSVCSILEGVVDGTGLGSRTGGLGWPLPLCLYAPEMPWGAGLPAWDMPPLMIGSDQVAPWSTGLAAWDRPHCDRLRSGCSLEH